MLHSLVHVRIEAARTGVVHAGLHAALDEGAHVAQLRGEGRLRENDRGGAWLQSLLDVTGALVGFSHGAVEVAELLVFRRVPT